MIVRQLFDQESCTYTYLLADGCQAILIDPVLDHADRDLRLIEQLGLYLKYCVETHTHADHITSADYLRKKTDCQIVVPSHSKAVGANIYINDGDTLHFGTICLEAIHTPGHTQDSFCYYIEKEKVVFTGDTLLVRKCGRTDFQEGSSTDLYFSINNLYMKFADWFKIYPGHDYDGNSYSSIGEEREWNTRCKNFTSLEEFERTMASLRIPYPKLMDRVIPINLRCGAEQKPSIKSSSAGEVLAIDIDDTVLITDGPPLYKNARTIEGAVEVINSLVEAGYIIDFYTARHSNLWDMTNKQLKDAGFTFRRLVTNKHPATVYIDDRAIQFKNWDIIKKELL